MITFSVFHYHVEKYYVHIVHIFYRISQFMSGTMSEARSQINHFRHGPLVDASVGIRSVGILLHPPRSRVVLAPGSNEETIRPFRSSEKGSR